MKFIYLTDDIDRSTWVERYIKEILGFEIEIIDSTEEPEVQPGDPILCDCDAFMINCFEQEYTTEVCRKIKETKPEIKVILMHSWTPYLDEVRDSGIADKYVGLAEMDFEEIGEFLKK